jgi:hypothetical protein
MEGRADLRVWADVSGVFWRIGICNVESVSLVGQYQDFEGISSSPPSYNSMFHGSRIHQATKKLSKFSCKICACFLFLRSELHQTD